MKRLAKFTFAAGMLALATQSIAASSNKKPKVSPQERAKIESVVHDYLLQKPEVIVEVLQILQRKQFEQAEQTVKQTQQQAPTYSTELFHEKMSPIAGNPNGKVTVVEFFDYQCPHCVDMAPVMEAIIKENPDVRIVYKEFPIRGPMSELATRAALAAQKQGKYQQMHDALMKTTKPINEEVIFEMATTNNIDVNQLKKDMTSKDIDTQIDKNKQLAQNLKLLGTPAIFIGKTQNPKTNVVYFPGQMTQKQLQNEINKASE